MNLAYILDEADVRIPNVFASAIKVDWLNEVNYEFFDIVKIPKTTTILLDGVKDTYSIPANLREKNVRKVAVGSGFYRSMIYDDISASVNYYTVDDTNSQMTFVPKPRSGSAIVVYDQMGTVPFTVSNLTVSPEAPPEYHWIYVLGLCVRIAKAMNDVVLANNYENDYKGNLSVAQQNFLRG
jgi:hypothetical protein